jgi:hypothetical protein
VSYIKNEIDKDLLASKKPKYSTSVGIVGHPKPDQLSKHLFEIKAGLHDENPIKTKP